MQTVQRWPWPLMSCFVSYQPAKHLQNYGRQWKKSSWSVRNSFLYVLQPKCVVSLSLGFFSLCINLHRFWQMQNVKSLSFYLFLKLSYCLNNLIFHQLFTLLFLPNPCSQIRFYNFFFKMTSDWNLTVYGHFRACLSHLEILRFFSTALLRLQGPLRVIYNISFCACTWVYQLPYWKTLRWSTLWQLRLHLL